MNVWFLIVAMAVAFVFGYRFYAKLLALDIFRLDKNYSTPAQTRADGREYVPTNPHFLFGHHCAAVGGAAMFAAPMAAVAWGWIPAFLWITLGSAVAAGTYGLGCFWLSLRHPKGLRDVVTSLIGRQARLALFLLAVTALVIIVAASAGFAASILAAYPGAVLPLAAIALIAVILGSFLHGRAEIELLPASVLALVASLSSIWFLSDKPLAFEGALVVRFGNSASVSVEATLVWVVLVLVYAFHAARLPVWKLMRPRGFLMSLLLAVTLMIFYIALALEHPTLTAPQFHSIASSPGALPWILLIVGPGALAGWQLLIIHGVTAREMRNETDARYVGYGTALVQGIVALSALLIAASVFPNAEAWSKQYPAAPSALDFPRLAVAYIDGFAHYAAALRLDLSLARHLAATVIAGLTLAVLEAAVRALKHVLAELAPPPTASTRAREGERGRLWIIVLVGGALALHDGRGLGGIAAWPLLALASLWLAAAGFAMIALALRAQARPTLLVGTLGAAVAGIAAWTSVAQLWMWWSVNAWTAFIAGLIVLLLATAILSEVVRALMRRPAVALDT